MLGAFLTRSAGCFVPEPTRNLAWVSAPSTSVALSPTFICNVQPICEIQVKIVAISWWVFLVGCSWSCLVACECCSGRFRSKWQRTQFEQIMGWLSFRVRAMGGNENGYGRTTTSGMSSGVARTANWSGANPPCQMRHCGHGQGSDSHGCFAWCCLVWKTGLAFTRLGLCGQPAVVSKSWGDCIEGGQLLSLRGKYKCETVILTAPYFYIRGGVLQWAGYDESLKMWRRLPPLDYLPDYCTPDPDLFKEYLVCTQDGIVCMNVSKSTEEKLILFDLLTRKWVLLPPLIHRRNPVLMHILVNLGAQSFQVVVAGSAKSGDEHLSRITEVFDSTTWTWKRTGDLPGPDYAVNDYQSGITKDGHLFCVAFLGLDSGRGILRYNLNKGIWLKHWTYPLPFATGSTILQLVENRGEIYLFSEQENGEGGVEHCVDRLECNSSEHDDDSWKLKSVVRNIKMGGRSLETYPEFVCVGFSEHQLCIFNALDHSGMVYDVKSFGEPKVLEAPTDNAFHGDGFYSLNPLTFAIHGSFSMKL